VLVLNRYKSVVVEEEPYLLELVRYLHLNPLRAQIVPDLRTLARYPWSGHSALLGRVPRPWQATAPILAQFGPSPRRARVAYEGFVKAGVTRGRRPDLQGGGLRRSYGGWQGVAALRRGREAYAADERILGRSTFVEQCRRVVAAEAPPQAPRLPLATLVAQVCRAVGIAPAVLTGGGRRPAVSAARAGIAYLWTVRLGHPGRPLAPVLGVHPAVVYQAARRGATAADRWDPLLKTRPKTT
jgi:putative transposase